ncbi:MAG: transposase [Oscillospiraceae bacterium]|nr:transposase [Oscillospiraceae bacterium]
MVDYAEIGPVHRTMYCHFPAKGKWNDKGLEEAQKRESFQTILELPSRSGTPLFVSIDDSVVPKTIPSSKAKRSTEATGWHYSHPERKAVYGYQVHGAIVGTGDTLLCCSLKRYSKEQGTKIDMTLEIIQFLPDDAGAYVLIDSWYTNPGVLDAYKEKNCHLISAMKTNRILYPEGKRTPAADLDSSLAPGCFHPVTVNGRTYMGSAEKAKGVRKSALERQ